MVLYPKCHELNYLIQRAISFCFASFFGLLIARTAHHTNIYIYIYIYIHTMSTDTKKNMSSVQMLLELRCDLLHVTQTVKKYGVLPCVNIFGMFEIFYSPNFTNFFLYRFNYSVYRHLQAIWRMQNDLHLLISK